MYTNTKQIFLVFQEQGVNYFNDRGESVNSLERARDHSDYVITIDKNSDITEVFDTFDIKRSVDRTGMMNMPGTEYSFAPVAIDGQKGGILTVKSEDGIREIQIPPEKIFQDLYTFDTFDFVLTSEESGGYSIIDKDGKKIFHLETEDVDDFRREVYKISLDMMLEAYDLGDEREGEATVNALLEKAQETGEISPEKIQQIRENLSSIEAHTLANTNKALQVLLEELSDEGVSLPLRNKGITEYPWWQPEDAPSFFGSVEVQNQDIIGFSNMVDFSRMYTYLQGTPDVYRGMNTYKPKGLNQVANFFIDHFTLPNPDSK